MERRLFKKLKAIIVSAAILVTSAIVPSAVNIGQVSAADDVEINFAKSLQYSIYFYDANMCGTGVSENNRLSWRGDCHTYDAELPLDDVNTNLTADFIEKYRDVLDPDGDGTVDVSGGFHDAGDHVKFGLPEAYSGSTLGWGYYEFRDSYKKTGQDDHIETILRYFNDYFMKCTYLDDNGDVVAFCYQVGDGDIDHAYWNSPELDTMDRRGWFATSEKPTTDCITNTAGSLAINYLNFKDTDPEYAQQCLKYAKALFKFAKENNKDVGQAEDGPKGYYASSKWEDDYCWAAAWLYKVTQDHTYLEDLYPYYDYYAAPCYVYCWNDMWGGVACILGEISDTYPDLIEEYKTANNKSPYEEMDCWSSVAKAVETYMTGGIGTITPGGYFWLNTWGSARYNTAAQFIALVYDKYNGGASEYGDWAKGQMEYIMGDNPINRCYIVGYSENSVKYPHHRAASGLTMAEDTREQKHVLYGALVGGPDASDQHNDVTADWIYNEVTIDYNAAFVGASAGLYEFYGDSSMKVTPDFPPQEEEEEIEEKYWVEGFSVDDGKVSAVTFYVYGTAPKADTNITVRYYFDTKGMTSLNKNDIELRQYYDQVSAETDYEAVLSEMKQYKDTIYYVEVSWPGYSIANSNKKYQFAVGSYNVNNVWDPSDDWSHIGLASATDSFKGVAEEAPNICVYSNGVLVGGTEPDGTTPVKEIKLKDIKKSVLKAKSSVAKEDINGDKKINAFDAAMKKEQMLSK